MLVVAGVFVAILLGMIVNSPSVLIYDEHFYVKGAHLLERGASLRDLVLAPLETAAGPLYPVIHWLVAPIIGLDAPGIRWLNPVLMAISALALSYALKCWGKPDPWARAAMIFAVPIMWVTVGMALTEVPAFCFMSMSVAFAAWAMTAKPEQRLRLWVGFVLSGICFGVAVLGRQTYLPAVCGFLAIAAFAPPLRWAALAGAVAAVAVPLPVFLLWGGLVEPDQRFVGGLDLGHGALAFCYLAVLFLILAPRFYLARWKWALVAGAIGALASFLWGGLDFQVAAGLASRLPPLAARLFQAGISAILVGGCAALVLASGVNMWLNRNDRIFILLMLLTLGLTATAVANVFQFSSRYLMTAFPFALLAVQPYFRPSLWAAARLGFGAAIGCVLLLGYYTYK